MSRFGRRRFLTSSAAVASAGVVAGASWPSGSPAESGAAERPVSEGAAARPPGPLRTGRLTVNGLTDPVGIDPDDCSFAWTLQASGRAVAQTGWRIVVSRTDPTHAEVVWDSGPVTSARQAFVAYTGPTLAADAAYRWTVEARGPGARWGPASAPARFTTALRDGDWQAQWLRPAGDSQQPDRVTYLRSEVTPPAGAIDRVTAYVSAAHTYRLFVDGAPVDAWPSFSYPDEQYVRAVDLTGIVTGGRRSAIGVLHRWYGPGQGRPGSSPACCSSSRSGTATAAGWSPGRTPRGASARPSGCPPRSATATSATSSNGWTAGNSPRGGRARATTTGRGRR